MNEEQMERIMSNSLGPNPMSTLMAAIVAGSRSREIAEMSPEELAYKVIKEQRVTAYNSYYSHIQYAKTCPSCEGAIVRGKKERRMDYKRGFKCVKCKIVHYI